VLHKLEGMKNLSSIFGAMPLLFTPNLVRAQGSGRVVSQGEYWYVGGETQKKPDSRKLDSWTMYVLPDGSYAVEVDLAVPPEIPRVGERHTFTSDFQPTGFTFSVPKLEPENGGPVEIGCDYLSAEMRCHMTCEGTTSSATLAQPKPYVFMANDEVPVFDTAWFVQMLVGQALRSIGYTTEVAVVTIADGETENSLALKVKLTEQVKYVGQEKIEILNQQILAHKFQLIEEDDPPQSVWLSSSGLLLQMQMGEGKIILSNYQGQALK